MVYDKTNDEDLSKYIKNESPKTDEELKEPDQTSKTVTGYIEFRKSNVKPDAEADFDKTSDLLEEGMEMIIPNFDLSEKTMMKIAFFSLLGQVNIIFLLIICSYFEPDNVGSIRCHGNKVICMIIEYFMCLVYMYVSMILGMLDLITIFQVSKRLDIIN